MTPITTLLAFLFTLGVLIVGSFMSVLDSSIVNVAIPKIQLELGATAQSVAWVVPLPV